MLTKKWWRCIKNPLLPIIIVAILCLALILPLGIPVLASDPTYSGGSGSSSDPYIIANKTDLDAMATFYQGSGAMTVYYYSLSNDINLTSTSLPIGIPAVPFNGHFNGNGHVISGLTIIGNLDNRGLFGVTSDATITSLGLQGVTISGNTNVGGLIGEENENTGGNSISNCWVSGTVTGNNCVGGLLGEYIGNYIAGYDAGDSISNCYSTVIVNGINSSQNVGGLVGYVQYGSLNNCFASGAVTGNQQIGGLVGGSQDLNMSYCYATGNVSGNETGTVIGLGGLVGSGTVYYGMTIQNCYTKGNVMGTGSSSEVGGLIGNISSAWGNLCNINYCYTIGNVTGGNPASGNGDTGGLIGSSSSCAITYCHTQGNVVGGVPSGNTFTGGLIGRSSNDSVIRHCWTSGSVMTGYQIGGLIGHVGNDADIMYCDSTGNVGGAIPAIYAGGLIGYSYASIITDCYSQSIVASVTYSAGLIGYAKNGVFQGTTQGAIIDCYTLGNLLTNNDPHNPVTITDSYNKTASPSIRMITQIGILLISGRHMETIKAHFLKGR
jgi:hypothetical protein